jgi:hypothetical protein
MADKPTESENRYAEALAQAKAKEIMKSGKSSTDANRLIDEIIDKDDLHLHSREKFRQMVWQKVDEMKQKAKDDREKKIIEEYEGKLQMIDGKMRPAGVQEKFSMRVKAGKFEVGNIGRRIWGHSIDADKLASLLDEVKDLEIRIEQNKVELEMLKAARKATATLIGSEKHDMTFGITKAGLVKDIYRNKIKSQGWSSLFSTESNLYQSYKAAKGIKEQHEEEYRKGKKKVIADLEKKGREFEKKKAILEAALAKIETLRENGRELFNKAFGEQLQVLQRNRDMMDDDDYRRHVGEIREKVKAFGKSTGIANMEFFLNEALGIKPEVTAGGKVVYAEPQTEVEKGKERVKIVKWWRENFGKEISEGDLTAFIEGLRKVDYALLNELATGTISKDNELVGSVFRFLFTGKLPDDEKQILSPTRCDKLSVERLMHHLRTAKKVSEEFKGNEDGLKNVFIDFAGKLPSRYKAEDFGYIYSSLGTSTEREEIVSEREKEHGKQVSEAWEKLTGEKLVDKDGKTVSGGGDKITALHDALTGSTLIDVGPDVFYEKVRNMGKSEASFINFFFTGKFKDDLILEKDRFARSPDNLIKAYLLVEGLFKGDKKPKDDEIKKICTAIKEKPTEKAADKDKKFFEDNFNEAGLNDGRLKQDIELYLSNVRKKPKGK